MRHGYDYSDPALDKDARREEGTVPWLKRRLVPASFNEAAHRAGSGEKDRGSACDTVRAPTYTFDERIPMETRPECCINSRLRTSSGGAQY